MIRTDLVPPQLGSPKLPMSMVCIHRALYTYERKWLWLSVMDCMEEITVELAETLPCPKLLGVD